MTPPVRNPPLSPSKEPRHLWQAGPLTYTAGGLATLFFWLLWGDFAWAMRDRSVGPAVQLLLHQFEASDFFLGLLLGTLPAGISMILGPIVSCKSDRHRGKWGRRIPFLAIPTPIIFLSMTGLGFSPYLGRHLHAALGTLSPGLNACSLLLIAVFWTCFEVATITANAVFGGLINDVVPKAVVGRFFALFRALSLIAGMIFNFWLMGKAEEHFTAIFVGIGMLYGVGFTMTCANVKEGPYPPPPPAEPRSVRGAAHGMKAYFVECFGHPFYRWYFAVGMLGALSSAPINAFSIFFAKSIALDMAMYGKLLALTYVISLVISYPLGALVDRLHPLRVSLWVLGLYAAVSLWGGVFARDIRTFSIAIVAHGVLSGAWFTASASLGQRLLPGAKYAQYSSALGLVCSIFGMVLTPAVGILLDTTGHAYRFTFLTSFVIALLGTGFGAILYSKFVRLGGVENYTAPNS